MKFCDTCRSTYPADFTSCPKDQAKLREISEFVPGVVIHDKYEILEKIGVGGMATVYRARHLHFNEELAIKVVSNRLVEDPAFLKRFKTEAVITRKLRHPNAVRLDDFDTTDDGRPFIVMEYVQGKPLRSLIQESGQLPLARALNIGRQAALALGAAHALGIVHRDMKPDNILIIPQPDGSDLVKILDFGIAKVREATTDAVQTQTGMVLGTPQYISPEQALGKKGDEVDGRADLYALGVVLYEMITGQLPFQSDTPLELLLQHIQTPPRPPHELKPELGIPPSVSRLLMKALEKDRNHRFQTGEEMAAALASPEGAALPLAKTTGAGEATVTHGTAAMAAAFSQTASASGTTGTPTLSAAAAAAMTARTPTPLPGVAATTSTKALGSDQLNIRARNAASEAAAAAPAKSSSRRKRYFVLAGSALALILVAMAMLLWPRKSAAPVSYDQPTTNSTADEPATQPAHRSASAPRRSSPPAQNTQTQTSPGALGGDKARAAALTAEGYARLQRKDFSGARRDFEEALRLDPGNGAAHKGLTAAIAGPAIQGVGSIFHR